MKQSTEERLAKERKKVALRVAKAHQREQAILNYINASQMTDERLEEMGAELVELEDEITRLVKRGVDHLSMGRQR